MEAQALHNKNKMTELSTKSSFEASKYTYTRDAQKQIGDI